MDSTCTLYIVRHGQTEWNQKGLLQGQSETDLTEEGVKQAKNTASQLENISFDAIFSSDLLRAKQTAEIILLERKLAITTTELLREKKFGPFEGKPYAAMKEYDEILDKLTETQQFLHKVHPEVESDEEMMARFIPFLREIAVGHGGKNVLIVTHGSIMRTFLIHVGFATYTSLAHGKSKISNGAYIVVNSDGIDFEVVKTVGIEQKAPETV